MWFDKPVVSLIEGLTTNGISSLARSSLACRRTVQDVSQEFEMALRLRTSLLNHLPALCGVFF